MDLNELRKMPLPKLRDLAKQTTDLEGVLGKKKEELIEAIAKAQGISFVPLAKDVQTISAIKQQIRTLKKQRDETLATTKDRAELRKIRRKIKVLKRQTRKLAAAAKRQAAAKPAAAPAA
ncbi:MAG TPA: Rho termination factor N-terminal domain-containing protein [Candidatus Acidoferrales bacterium]|nr:Rho termination factor N-terminal domain-containing protein [Candidatus Acidoferrales bacterium]